MLMEALFDLPLTSTLRRHIASTSGRPGSVLTFAGFVPLKILTTTGWHAHGLAKAHYAKASDHKCAPKERTMHRWRLREVLVWQRMLAWPQHNEAMLISRHGFMLGKAYQYE
jgi:hypothetical protein